MKDIKAYIREVLVKYGLDEDDEEFEFVGSAGSGKPYQVAINTSDFEDLDIIFADYNTGEINEEGVYIKLGSFDEVCYRELKCLVDVVDTAVDRYLDN